MGWWVWPLGGGGKFLVVLGGFRVGGKVGGSASPGRSMGERGCAWLSVKKKNPTTGGGGVHHVNLWLFNF